MTVMESYTLAVTLCAVFLSDRSQALSVSQTIGDKFIVTVDKYGPGEAVPYDMVVDRSGPRVPHDMVVDRPGPGVPYDMVVDRSGPRVPYDMVVDRLGPSVPHDIVVAPPGPSALDLPTYGLGQNRNDEYFVEESRLASLDLSAGHNTVEIRLETSAGGSQPEALNLRPVIGILAQELSRSMQNAIQEHGVKNYSSYIAASYVKSMEGAGARVVPIMIDQDQDYYKKLGQSLNGILFPGGAVSITNTSGYGAAGDALYELVMAANARGQRMPLWGTCLGFEMLVYLAAGRRKPLTRCSASNTADPLVFLPGWQESQLWKEAPGPLRDAVQKENLTSNFHMNCVTPESFQKLDVSENYNITSVNMDRNGLLYVSTIEHKRYPIFGTQWHPEKNSYEWRIDYKIPHSEHAVELERYVSRVFVQQARRNNNTFASEEELEDYLIYNYSPFYLAKLYKSSFQQAYFFE